MGFENIPSTKEDIEDTEIDKITEFATDNEVSGEELFTAYQLSLGITAEEQNLKDAPREVVHELAERLTKYADDGFAISRIPELIDAFKEVDSGFIGCIDLINEIALSEREKELLIGIVSNPRPGELTIKGERTGEEKIFKIQEAGKNGLLFLEITETLKQLAGDTVLVSFES